MTKEIYFNVLSESLKWAQTLKDKGELYWNIKTHIMSKNDGIGEISVKDTELSIDDFREVAEYKMQINSEIMMIESDAEPEKDL